MKIHEICWSYITVYSNNFIFMGSYLIHGSENSQQTPRGGILIRKKHETNLQANTVIYSHVWISVGLTLCQGLFAGFLMSHPLAQLLKPWDVKVESKNSITSQMRLICLRTSKPPTKNTNLLGQSQKSNNLAWKLPENHNPVQAPLPLPQFIATACHSHSVTGSWSIKWSW